MGEPLLDLVPPTASRVLDLVMLPLEGDRTIHEIADELKLEHREMYEYIERFRERGLVDAT